MNTAFRRVAALTLALPLTVSTATAADADTHSRYKASGTFASVGWLDRGDEDPATGETSYVRGDLYVAGHQSFEAFGSVQALSCPQGAAPDSAGEPCTVLEYLSIVASPGEITLTVNRRLNSASISGHVAVYRFDEDGNGELVDTEQVAVNIIGTGPTSTYRDSSRYRDSDGQRFSSRSTNTSRVGLVSGSIGDALLGDEVGDSYAYFGFFRHMERSVTP